jgi:hypothetical protein
LRDPLVLLVAAGRAPGKIGRAASSIFADEGCALDAKQTDCYQFGNASQIIILFR